MKRLLLFIGTCVSLSAPFAASAMMVTASQALIVNVHGPATPQSVAPGMQRIPMLTLDLANETKGEVKIETIRVLHRGLGEHRDILGVYLMSESGQRVSDRFAFASNDAFAEIRIWPPLILDVGESMVVLVVGDMAPDAAIAGEHRLWLSSDADVDAGDDTPVTVLQGSTLSRVLRTSGVERSVIDVDYPGLNERVRYGKNRLVGRIRLNVDGKSKQAITSLTLTNDGKAQYADLQNIYIESNRGKRLSKILPQLAGRSGKTATFTFDKGLLIDGGSSVILNVRADALVSRRKTIQFLVEEPGDVIATPVTR